MRRIALAVGVLALLPAPAAAQDGLDATIRRTPHGVPHIEAKDYAGLGYGYGYALAEDNLCTIAEQYVTVRAERSRFFGPDATYTWRANSSVNRNLESDFAFKRIIDTRVVEGLIAQAPPNGPRPEVRDAVRGYTAGYNRYLRETGVANLPDPACRGAAWVRPIEEIDVYRRFYQLALLASTGVALDGVGGAQPPTPALPAPPLPAAGDFDELADRLPLGGIGSNAYGLGRDKTSTGKGMLLGNPHFPWDGAERFYQAHLTIPGRIDVSGASLLGVPVVLIDHTRGLAWSHTVSTAFRFTPFELTLVPGSPTTYLVDGQPQQMTAQEVTVQARTPSGGLEPRSRTLYSTRYGPVFTSLLGLPLFPWTPAKAFALGDANAGNFRYLNHFFETNLAQTTREYDAVLRRNQGIPWVNSIGADARGEAGGAQALTDAVAELRGLGLPLGGRLGDVQAELRGGERIPIHGGPGEAGLFNAINVQAADLRAGKGYETVPHGSSFVQAVSFVDGPCPVVPRTILTYSQSANAASPFFADQTRMYSRKQWNPVPFCRDDVLAQTVSTTRLGANACVARTALGRVSARRRGRGVRVRWAGGGRATVDVLRGKRRVAHVNGRRGRATVRVRRPGVYVVRVRKAGDTRRLGVRVRRGGRARVLRAFERRARCARVRLLTLGKPAFGGRLAIRYRLAARARVRITVRRGGRVVRVIRRRAARSGRVRLAARRGPYRVTLRVGRTRVSVYAIRL